MKNEANVTVVELADTELAGVTGGAWYDGTFIGDIVTGVIDGIMTVRERLGGYANGDRDQATRE